MKKKKWLIPIVVVLALALGASSILAANGENPEEMERVFTQSFNVMIDPLEVEIIKWPNYQVAPGKEVLTICRVKNHSSLIEEVIYNLSSNYGLGGIEAVIDYDGPFGPKNPEPYNWNKVPVRPGEEQYLYVSFPLPAVYEKELTFTITVDRWLGPRG